MAQAIIANARHVVLVADSSKFERSAPVRLAQLPQIGTFVTDRCPSEALRDLFAPPASGLSKRPCDASLSVDFRFVSYLMPSLRSRAFSAVHGRGRSCERSTSPSSAVASTAAASRAMRPGADTRLADRAERPWQRHLRPGPRSSSTAACATSSIMSSASCARLWPSVKCSGASHPTSCARSASCCRCIRACAQPWLLRAGLFLYDHLGGRSACPQPSGGPRRSPRRAPEGHVPARLRVLGCARRMTPASSCSMPATRRPAAPRSRWAPASCPPAARTGCGTSRGGISAPVRKTRSPPASSSTRPDRGSTG